MNIKPCPKCGQLKSHSDFHKDKKTKDGLYYSCKVCNIAKAVAWEQTNKSQANARKVAWAEKNPEKRKEQYSKYAQNNPEKCSTASRIWKQENKDKHAAMGARYRAAKLKATPPWLNKQDLAEIQQFYTIANQLTSLNSEIYHVDHIVPLQGSKVCGLHVPWNLTVLPGRENMSKSNHLILPKEQIWA